MNALKRGWIVFGLLFLCSCNLPSNQPASQDISLRETVQALNTLVAEKNQTPTPRQLPGDTPQAAVTSGNLTPNAPQSNATAITHQMLPGEPGWVERWFSDTNSSSTAAEKRAPGGDDFSKNVFERPFSAQDMTYRPDLDINKAEISSDVNFVYVSIILNGTNPQSGGLTGWYGVELDTDLDGRGNYLLLADSPQGSTWKMENVSAYKDTAKKVGGAQPMKSDPSTGYTGYDQLIFSVDVLADPDAAWARISPKGSSIVDLAFKRSLIGGADKFLWNVWADDGPKNPAGFDYNDHFSASEAGSPYKGADYPLKALAQVDNTCRETFQFTPSADIPGLCSPPKTITSTTPSFTPSPSPTPTKNITSVDLEIVDIFLNSSSKLTIKVRNSGPSSMPNSGFGYSCEVGQKPNTGNSSIWNNTGISNQPLAPGTVIDLDSTFQVDLNNNSYDVTCTLNSTINDPKPGNNAMSKNFPTTVPGGGGWGVLTTDLAVTNMYLKALPSGNLVIQLQNNGPAVLTDVWVNIDCYYALYSYTDGSVLDSNNILTNLKLNLSVGQSMEFDTVLNIDQQQARTIATCSIVPNFKDPVTANDSLTVSFPPAP